MRKLLILMLVLGMASMANAAFTLVVGQTGTAGVAPGQGDYVDPVDSELFLEPTDYLWVGVHNDTDGVPGALQKGSFYLAMVTTPEASWTGNWVQYKPPLVAGAPDNYYNGAGIPTYATGLPWAVDMWYLDLSDPTVNPNLIGVLDAKELHCDEAGYPATSVQVVLLDASLMPLDSILIHQIPEPMTMVLLGIGGLLLRRRK